MIEYLHNQLCDELHGAHEYIKLAIELKATKPRWAMMYYDMANTELSHADNIKQMMEDQYNELVSTYGDNMPEYISTAKREAMEKYTSKYPIIKTMMDMYAR